MAGVMPSSAAPVVPAPLTDMVRFGVPDFNLADGMLPPSKMPRQTAGTTPGSTSGIIGKTTARVRKFYNDRVVWPMRAAVYQLSERLDYSTDIKHGNIVLVGRHMRPVSKAHAEAAKLRNNPNAWRDLGENVVVMALHVLNVTLYKLTVRPGKSGRPTPDWVVENFRLAGVVTTDDRAGQYTIGTRQLAVDVVNWTTEINNIFDELVRHFDRLWLLALVVAVNQKPRYMSTTGSPTPETFQMRDDNGDPITHVTQVVPYVGNLNHVPARHLLCRVQEDDGFDTWVQGHAMKIGNVDRPPRPGEQPPEKYGDRRETLYESREKLSLADGAVDAYKAVHSAYIDVMMDPRF